MRCLNEGIARKANKEDNCKGRFWEGRFKSQALLDEQALLACMVYVDLNPIRAGIAETLEDSAYTSIQQRIADYVENSTEDRAQKAENELLELSSFIGDNPNEVGIPFHLKDYFELTDWTGRAILEDKTGFIAETTPYILSKLDIDTNTWIEMVGNFGSRFYSHVGPVDKMDQVCERLGKKWLQGIRACKQFWDVKGSLIGKTVCLE